MKNYSAARQHDTEADNFALLKRIRPQNLLERFDSYTVDLKKATTSQTIPPILDGARREIQRLINDEGTSEEVFSDYLYVIERTAVAAIKNAMLPIDLRGPVVFAYDCKRPDGQPGSEERPHYRELNQVRKATGRLLIVAKIKVWVANMYDAVCDHFGYEHPETIKLDPDLVAAVDELWGLGKEELKWPTKRPDKPKTVLLGEGESLKN